MSRRPRSPHRLGTAAIASLQAAFLLPGCGGGGTTSTVAATPPPASAPASAPGATAACTVPAVTPVHTATAANPPQLVVLDKAGYPDALCNDGSAAAYVLRPGAGAAATRWIVSLQGGGECYDPATCSSRAANMPALVSTASYQADPASAFGQAGLLGATPGANPDFYDASVVQVLYCSSDDWSGAKASTVAYQAADPATWNFQGRAILRAVIADLRARHGLESATEVMLTGQSAGGVGVFANANPVAALLPSAARYVAYSDAGFGNGAANFSAGGQPPDYTDTASTPNQVAKRIPALPLWNGSGDPACAAATPADAMSQVACYSGKTLLAPGGTIALPMLVSVSQEDTNQLGTAGVRSADIDSGHLTAAESGYVAYFASNMRANLNSTNANVSLFSPDVFVHVEATDPAHFNASIAFPSGALTLQQQVGAWYRAPCSAQRNVAN